MLFEHVPHLRLFFLVNVILQECRCLIWITAPPGQSCWVVFRSPGRKAVEIMERKEAFIANRLLTVYDESCVSSCRASIILRVFSDQPKKGEKTQNSSEVRTQAFHKTILKMCQKKPAVFPKKNLGSLRDCLLCSHGF